MEIFQKAIIFITRTETRLTTTSTTLSVYQHQNIQSTMQNQTSGLGQKKTSNNLLTHKTRQKSGTLQMTAWSGIVNMARKLGLIVRRQLNLVNGVKKTTKHTIRTGQGSAIRTVKRITEGTDLKAVYDLTVDHHHAYVANGVLVSNSDAFRYLAIGYRPMAESWGKSIKRNVKGIV